jgi:hypothetical protein
MREPLRSDSAGGKRLRECLPGGLEILNGHPFPAGHHADDVACEVGSRNRVDADEQQIGAGARFDDADPRSTRDVSFQEPSRIAGCRGQRLAGERRKRRSPKAPPCSRRGGRDPSLRSG